MGVARGDREGYRRQELRNFQLFDAPHVAVISTDAALGEYGAIDCGGYVATFLLAAQANGGRGAAGVPGHVSRGAARDAGHRSGAPRGLRHFLWL